MKQMDRLVAGHLQKGDTPERLPANFPDKVLDKLDFPHLQPVKVRPLVSLRAKLGLVAVFVLLGAGLLRLGHLPLALGRQWMPKWLTAQPFLYTYPLIWVCAAILLAVLLLAVADQWLSKRLPTSKNHPFR